MTKQEFLKNLKEELEKNKVQNVQDILTDYEEHFVHGLSKGKTEVEICEGLGFPSVIAKAYQTESLISEIKNPEKGFNLSLAVTVIGRLLVIAPFNFLILFIPGVVIFALLASGWAVSVAIGSASLALLSMLPFLGTVSAGAWAWVTGLSTSFGLLGLAILGGMVMFVITKYIVLAIISYLQWNLKFILQK
ncbi:hypothetical protein AZI87_05155 [Bdellovibrio bacteriovorus]|uniref:DUF1700 domain-containing protein n=1 Tax=Bdellovibrio bacteriovorus TaxID=959 RepID=A0A162GPC7_BDEBC|nr:DUF1700 domain-containing protein [Bdellovibrio bacteriovorus]KYG68625.1 hypothetical protein AZI87_05155 [Bdellovibrio bacteriovorus]